LDPIARWRRTWESLDRSPPPALIEQLVAAYSEPHRAYHTLQHLAECFGHLDACPHMPSHRGLLELALWFHDAVYDTKASDNEERSASWSRRALPALTEAERLVVEALVLVTKHDASPRTDDEKLLLDIDLSILGAPSARFAEYELQVRREYDWVPEEAYRAGRSKILREFQQRPVIYHTPWFHESLEHRARVNLESSLESLAD